MATVLSSGDIAIVHYNSDDPDSFAFVFLRDVEAGTTINFTDQGWQAAGGFRPGEGTATYTAPTAIAAGTVVSVPVGSMAFNFLGDQIIAYQGTAASPTFLYAIDFADSNNAFAGDATSTITSAVPTGLTLGVTAVAIPFDNATYTGPAAGSQLDLLEAISDPTNWTGSDVLRHAPPVVFGAGRPAIDLDFDNSTHGGRDYRTDYGQGGTSVKIGDTDIRIADSDGDTIESAQIKVGNPQPDNLLSVNSALLPAGITASAYDPVTGILTLNGPASLADYETAIGLVEFSSTSEEVGEQKRIEVIVFNGNEWSPEAKTFVNIVAGTASPALDLDANDSNGGGVGYTATFTEGGPAIPIADLDVSITDADSPTLVSATITLGINRQPEDVLSFTGPAGPITASIYNPATGVLMLTGPATLAEYQAALRQVVFSNTSATPFTGDRVIEVTVNDGTVDSNIARAVIHVVDVVNSPPALNLDADFSTTGGADYLTTFTDGGPGVVIADVDVSIIDSDSPAIASATITLTNPHPNDELAFNGPPPAGITVSGSGTGAITLAGLASPDAYQDALRQITFNNTGTNPTSDTRIIEVVVNDGAAASNTANAIVQVVEVNNSAPTLDLDGDDSTAPGTTYRATFTENGLPAPIADIDTLIDDPDPGLDMLASARITLTNPQAGDVLTVPASLPGGITASVYDPVTGLLTLTGTASLADYQAVLAQIRYSAAGENPVADTRIVEIIVNDGVNDSDAATALITVAAENDPPAITVDGTATFIENGAALPLSPNAILTDPDDTELEFAGVLIEDGSFPGDGDILTINGTTSGSVDGVTFQWDPTQHALTLFGPAPVAVYQELLRHIEFRSSSDNPTDFNASPTRTLTWVVSDGPRATTATTTLNIVARNDAPEATVAATATYTENDPPVTISPAAIATDVDSLNLTAGQVTIVSGGFAGDVLTVTALRAARSPASTFHTIPAWAACCSALRRR
jgi:hypothetical protein